MGEASRSFALAASAGRYRGAAPATREDGLAGRVAKAKTAAGSPTFTVSDFLAVVNQTLEYAYSSAAVIGEVSSFKVNQGKWVFFDLKDADSSLGCFMTRYQLRIPLEDGMKVAVRGIPKLTKWGKFSFTVQNIAPVGQGSIKKAYELLKAKLTKEGLFDPAKKRPLPDHLQKIGVISSMQAAGYADFIKIINERWGGLDIQVAHTSVQGLQAADQIIRALQYLNEHGEVQVIAIIRGGGSADDLAVFNDEQLVRAIAASKIPVITGIGHEVDESLADLAADIRASTPSNAAQMLTPDRQALRANVQTNISRIHTQLLSQLQAAGNQVLNQRNLAEQHLKLQLQTAETKINDQLKLLARLDPELVLKQGYAIITGQPKVGAELAITTARHQLIAEVKQLKERNH